MKLSTLIVTRVDNKGLLIGYKSVRDEIIYNESWDLTAELLINDKVKENRIKKSKIGGGKINSSEIGKDQVQGNEVGKNAGFSISPYI